MNTQTQPTKKISSQAAAAQLIRKELKAAFPSIKFCVNSRSFSMGDAVDVRWMDGPTVEQVDAFTDKYQYGRFNGMEDMYEITNRVEGLPQTKYVQTSRSMSPETRASIIKMISQKYAGCENFTGEEYVKEQGQWGSALIYREYRLIDFCKVEETIIEEDEHEAARDAREAKREYAGEQQFEIERGN